MKNHLTKLGILLAFTAVALTSCSLQYRHGKTYRHNTPANNGHRPPMHSYQAPY